MRLTPKGTLQVIANAPGWLDYPVMLVFGTTRSTLKTLYVENGSFQNGTPNIVALHVRIGGPPLP